VGSGALLAAPPSRCGILYWDTAIGVHDIGELPLRVGMAESGDRNALGQDAFSGCEPPHSHAG
jgi:hypothetical protein